VLPENGRPFGDGGAQEKKSSTETSGGSRVPRKKRSASESPTEMVPARTGEVAGERPTATSHLPAGQLAVFNEAMAELVRVGMEAQRTRNGRELAIFERDFERIALLADALMGGNYRDTAARLAGIAESGVRAWVRAADDGDLRYLPIATVIRSAEAIAEAEAVTYVRKASRDPRFWAAGMTWLERKYPDAWGRRESESGPKVQVIVGAGAAQVQVNVASTPSAAGSASDPD
jgi:hypothetical protein